MGAHRPPWDDISGGSGVRRAIAVVVVGMLASMGLALGTATPAGAQASIESEFVAKINSLRASKGLGSLSVHGELTSIGRNWAAQMARVGEISHNPNFPNQVSADWLKLGENVGRGYDVSSLHDAFVASPAHYKNLVDGAFTHIGVGVVVSNGTIFTSHQFMHLNGATAARPSAPAPTAAPSAPAAPRAPRVTRPPAAARTPAAPKPAAPKAAPTAAAPAQAAPAAPAEPAPRPARVLLSLEQLKGLTPQ